MEITNHTPGTFCWIELSTTDQNAAKKFYSELFGWAINDVPMGPEDVYTMFQLNGRDVAAACGQQEEQISQGIPPNWLSYIAVENADETAKAITAAGGSLMMEPFDVFDVGRMTVAQDPTGATFAIWQPRTHIGVGVKNELNAMCWQELATGDVEAAKKFYSTVFGWDPQTKGEGAAQYTEIYADGKPIGGMMAIQAEWGNVPPNWTVYYDVADCDACVEKAKSLGANVCMPPVDIPNVGRFAVLQDPQGAAFNVIKLNPHSA
jgi:predicted enzyme related to lactoylglutathione lyase